MYVATNSKVVDTKSNRSTGISIAFHNSEIQFQFHV